MLARKVNYVLVSISCPWPYSQLLAFLLLFFPLSFPVRGCDKPQNWPWILHLLQFAIWILALSFINKHIYASWHRNTTAYSHVFYEKKIFKLWFLCCLNRAIFTIHCNVILSILVQHQALFISSFLPLLLIITHFMYF